MQMFLPTDSYVKAEEAQLIFEYLDKDQSNNLDVKEFSLVAEAMLVEFDRADSYKTMVENRFPETYNSESYQVRTCLPGIFALI